MDGVLENLWKINIGTHLEGWWSSGGEGFELYGG